MESRKWYRTNPIPYYHRLVGRSMLQELIPLVKLSDPDYMEKAVVRTGKPPTQFISDIAAQTIDRRRALMSIYAFAVFPAITES